MWNQNDPYGPHGLFTVQHEREERARQQTAEAQNAWRKHITWSANYAKEQDLKDRRNYNTGSDYCGWRWW